MGNDWLALKADYFEPICREVFEEYLRKHGFARGEADEIGALTYFRKDFHIRFHYNVEERPRYSPLVSVGILGGAMPIPNFNEIGLWYAVPPESDVREYGLWLFSNAGELKLSLTRIRDEVVEAYARPLWEHPEQLERLIARRYGEAVAEQNTEALKRKKDEAAQAFRAQDYRRAATLYGQIEAHDLSPAEQKRYELSKKYSP
jgi:hypothetical protein